METNKFILGDSIEVLRGMPDKSVQCCVTSPPYYGLRDYGMAGQIGLEETPEAYVQKLYETERPERGYPGGASHGSGLLISRSGNKQRKSAIGRDCPSEGVDGSVPWEGYFRNKRSVWTVSTKPFSEAHFATFPPELITPCILAGCPVGGIVLDPFMGAGTVAVTCHKLGRHWIGIELNPAYVEMAQKRYDKEAAQTDLFPPDKPLEPIQENLPLD